jgi:hypothetical protein
MMLKLWGGSGPWTGNGRTQRGCGAKHPLCSVSRRSPPLGQLTLAAITESVGAATIAGAKCGNARFSGPWTLADPVGHSYDCFLAARTHRPDPKRVLSVPHLPPQSSRLQRVGQCLRIAVRMLVQRADGIVAEASAYAPAAQGSGAKVLVSVARVAVKMRMRQLRG